MNDGIPAVPEPTGIMHLLSTASAALETDVNAASACLQRALTLVRARDSYKSTHDADAANIEGGLAPWQTRLLRTYLEEHLAGKVTAGALATSVHLSASQFFRAFRESFGMSPMAYMAQLRMQHAQRLMQTTNESLSQIALACGLCDQAHLTRTFRRLVGTTPHQWRLAALAR